MFSKRLSFVFESIMYYLNALHAQHFYILFIVYKYLIMAFYKLNVEHMLIA